MMASERASLGERVLGPRRRLALWPLVAAVGVTAVASIAALVYPPSELPQAEFEGCEKEVRSRGSAMCSFGTACPTRFVDGCRFQVTVSAEALDPPAAHVKAEGPGGAVCGPEPGACTASAFYELHPGEHNWASCAARLTAGEGLVVRCWGTRAPTETGRP